MIFDTIGKVPRYMRPTFGSSDARTIAIFRALGLIPVQWTRSSGDTMYNSEASYRNITWHVKNWINSSNPEGIISLHHSSFYRWSEKALPSVVEAVKNSTYKAVKMSECLNKQGVGGPYLTSGLFYSFVTSPIIKF